MTKEEIEHILKTAGLSLNSKRKAVVAGEQVSDTVANTLLKAQNVTIEQIRVGLAELAKKPVAVPEDLRYKDRMSEMEIVCPAFTNEIKWNKADEEIFGFFYFSKTSDSGTHVLLISNKDTEYRSIVLSNNALNNLSDITEACAGIKYKDENGVVRNLYDHITHAMEQLLREAVEQYRKLDAIAFGTWAVHHLPSIMLNNYKLYSVQEQKDVETPAGTKETMFKPHSVFFRESPFQCLASHYDTLMAVPSRRTRMPKLFSNDMSEPALHHIDLEHLIDHENPHPTWEHYLKRFRPDEAKVFKAFVWSIFDAENMGRQALYLYDKSGLGGKTAMENALATGIGHGLVAAIQKDSLSNQFGLEKIYDKRVVFIDDNKNPNLIRGEKMHLILGGGLGDIEPKGKKAFTFRMQCKVIASGNVPLHIDPYATHERSRVIVLEPKLTDDMIKEFAVVDENGDLVRGPNGRPKFIGDVNFEKKLIDEFRSFLADCKEAYAELCPTRSSIIISDEMEEILDNMSEDIYDIFDEQFEIKFNLGEGLCTSVREFTKTFNDVVRSVDVAVGSDATSKISDDNFMQHVLKKYNIRKQTVRIGGKAVKGYTGISVAVSTPTAKVPSDQFNQVPEDTGEETNEPFLSM